MKPERIQLSRRKGFKLPPNTIVVARPSKWGNPFVVGKDGTTAECVRAYRLLMNGSLCVSNHATPAAQNEAHMHACQHLGDLRGKNLACWCKLKSACHADILLEMANS